MIEIEETLGLILDLVAEGPIEPKTRFDADGRVGVEWRGRCWVWLNGEAPVLMDVKVCHDDVARLLEPGHVRRVRAMLAPVETPEGRVAGLNVLAYVGGVIQMDPKAAVRELEEGGKVRIGENTLRHHLWGKTGTLLRYNSATIEVEGRRYSVGVSALEPVCDPSEWQMEMDEQGESAPNES